MAVFPLKYLTTSDVPVAFNERYKTFPLGKKFAGQPKGVYVGFIPSTLGGVLTLSPDPARGYSLAKVPSRRDPSGMDIIVTDPVELDFTGQPDVDFPLLVVARSRFYDDPDRPTTASIVTRSGTVSSVQDNEALVCIVNGPAASITALSDPMSGQQDSPLAFDGVNFGFMPGGAIEDLRAAADIVNEVVASRVGLDGTVYSDLSTRLAVDYSATSMAERLGLAFRALRSNDYDVDAGASSVIVSGSFSEIDRDFLPEITLSGSGSETIEGAVAGPNDPLRNVVLIQNADTGYRLLDNPTDRRVVYGRLTGPNTSGISGEWQFLNASDNLTTTDSQGQALVEVMVGDSVVGPDGKHYEVESISTNNALVLKNAFQGASATVASVSIRRWRVEFKTLVSGVETSVQLDSDVSIRFFFPAFLSRGISAADWKNTLHTAAEREPLSQGTVDVPGLVQLAATGVRLGEIRIQNAGAPLGGGPFHTINFSASEASVAVTTIDGEVVVNEIGPVGPPGIDGASGGPGPTGGPGPGYSELNPFELSGLFSNPSGTVTPYSFTMNMGHNVRYVHGGIATFKDRGLMTVLLNPITILGVSIPSAMEGRIEIEMGSTAFPDGDTDARVFLSSAGD